MNIDTSKENIQPLRGGRDVSRLVPALEAQHDEEMRQQLKQERLEFENRINTYNGPDPLNDWFEFICWTEQSYPKKGHEGSIDQLVRKCLTIFEHNSQYFQDTRMIKLWMKYIDTQPNPTEIYWTLHNRGVGTMVADLYIGWAYYYHAANDYQHARHIYKLGLKAHAQPIIHLQSCYDNFKSSYLEQQQQPGDIIRQQRNQDSLAEQRHALTSLRPFKRKNVATVASQRTGDNVRNMNPGVVAQLGGPGSSRGAIPKSNRQVYIYEDGMEGDNMGAPGSSRNPTSILENQKKENVVEPGPWTRPKGLNPGLHLPSNTPFQIHEDPVQLRFPPCLVDWSDWCPPMYVPDMDSSNTRPMYIKSQVYQRYREYSFEEINAMKFFKKLAGLGQQQIATSSGNMQTSGYQQQQQQQVAPSSGSMQTSGYQQHEPYQNQQQNTTGQQEHFVTQNGQQHELYVNQQNELYANQQRNNELYANQQNNQQQQVDQQYVVDQQINQQYSREQNIYNNQQNNRSSGEQYSNQLNNGQYVVNQQNNVNQHLQFQQYQQHVNQQHNSMLYNEPAKNDYENHLIDDSVTVTEQYNPNQSRLPGTPEHHSITSQQPLMSSTHIQQTQQPLMSGTHHSITSQQPLMSSTHIQQPQQHYPGQHNLTQPNLTGQHNLTQPNLTGQHNSSQPHLTGQHNSSQPHLTGQHNSSSSFVRAQSPANISQHMSRQNISHQNLVQQNISHQNLVHAQQQSYVQQPGYGQQNMSQQNLQQPGTPRQMISGHNMNASNQYMSPHQNTEHLSMQRNHNSFTNHSGLDQMQTVNSVTIQTKEIMKEVDDWYHGVQSPNKYHNQEVHNMHQQHQPLTIYQDPVTEQPHNLRANQQSPQVYLTERQSQQPTTPQQQYINNENMLYAGQQQTQLAVRQPLVNHASPVLEHNYTGTHYQSPGRNQHIGHGPQVNTNQYNIQHTPDSNGTPRTRYQYPATPNQAFNETCTTQAFDANLCKAQISTPVKKELISPAFKEQNATDENSPNLVHLLSNNLDNEEILYASREIVQMKPHLSAIMENTENQTTPSVESIQTSSLNSANSHQNISTQKPNRTPVQKANDQKILLLDSPDKPKIELKTESPKVFVISKSKDTKLIQTRCVTPPNKYTEYRIKSDNSPVSKHNDSALPGTPEIVRKSPIIEPRNFMFATKPSPNISRSMKKSLHISINDNSNSNNNKWKQMDDSSVDDYEMDCQDLPEETEKSYSDAIIKKHLSKEVIDPFNSELCEAFLNKIGFPNRDSQSFVSVHNIPQLKQGMNCTVGPKHYAVEKELGRGAFASIYRAVDSGTGETVALKYQKPPRIWEYYICQEIRKRVSNTDMLPGFMQVSTALVCRSSSILVSEFGRYGSLLNASNKVKQAMSKSLPEIVVMSIASQLLSVVYYLHQSKIIHGDIKPDNILLMNIPMENSHIPFIQFIDFGCAIDMSLFPEGTEFKTVVTTDGFTCTEMQEGRPWTYQTDLFCLAGTVHVCLYGEYMKLCKRGREWAIKANVPRYFQRHIWQNFFAKLLNITNSDNLPDLHELKNSFDEHLSRNQKDYGEKIRLVANIMNGR